MLSFGTSKNVFIEYAKSTFYVCPYDKSVYDNLVYIIYLQGKRSSSFILQILNFHPISASNVNNL